ncbi:MAG TPA: hypothetical protein DCO77_08300, partial [Nitrospiraceae bacterium]|nr:hypothetical protein [Nitrospiraceae bacterium]
EWIPASINMPLQLGDRLWVPELARTVVRFAGGTMIRLDEESALDILTLDEGSAQLYLAQGRAYLNFWYVAEGSLQVETPLASVRVYNRSIFKVDVAEDGTTDIAVLKGIVDVESRSGTTTVTSGKIFTVRDTGYTDLASLGSPDSWEEWNRERDTRLAGQGDSSEYLPPELRASTEDLDAYGSWAYVEGYNYVWTPSVIHVSDWAPYRHGRWVWRGSDYVWISYEPWGWVPYHYGRWIFTASIGYCWVPPAAGAVSWGPGFVSWVYTPTTVAWLPLAPGELYYGYGYYGPLSVNITHINITKIRKRIVHKNVHVHHAVTMLSRKAFLSGKGRAILAKENPFLRERASQGRPQWKPRKATRLPVIKDIPQRRLPPKKLKRVLVKEVRKERPFIKKRRRSVFQGNEIRRPVIVSTKKKRARITRRGTIDSSTARRPSRPFKEKKIRVNPRRTGRPNTIQKPNVMKQGEKRQSIRDTIRNQERPRVKSKARVRPQPPRQGAARYGQTGGSEKLKQRSQAQVKARSTTVRKNRSKQQAVQSTRPQKQGEKQNSGQDKSEYQGQGQGQRKQERNRSLDRRK